MEYLKALLLTAVDKEKELLFLIKNIHKNINPYIKEKKREKRRLGLVS
jgi:hypothetical protein